MIDGWKDEAEQGGVYSGDLEIDDDMSLGPLKITGDLDIDSGVTLTLTGTIYVQGDVDLESNVAVVLDEAFGSQSGMIITDKDIDINSGTDFYGSSNGGVLLLLTESSNTSSIDVDPGGGKGSDVVLYAPNGTVTIDAQALQVSAKEVVLKPGSKINYHAKLLNLRLLGDSGGDLQWAFVPGSRTEQ